MIFLEAQRAARRGGHRLVDAGRRHHHLVVHTARGTGQRSVLVDPLLAAYALDLEGMTRWAGTFI